MRQLHGRRRIPRNPKGRKIALNIAWLPADDKGGGTPDPVFFLAGGPGQAATEYASQIDLALREVRKQRDIVLIDQRGTGKSNPLDCRDAKGERAGAGRSRRARCEAALAAYVGAVPEVAGRPRRSALLHHRAKPSPTSTPCARHSAWSRST